MNACVNTATNSESYFQPSKWGKAAASFGELPVANSHLFQVNPEVSSDHLLDHARNLAVAIRETLLHVDGDLDGNQVWLLWNSLDQLVGLLQAVEFDRRKQARGGES